jgi:hypothetical protein
VGELSVQYETVRAGLDVSISCDGSLPLSAKPVLLLVAESGAVYRPRRPEQIAFYQLFDKHFDDYVYAYPSCRSEHLLAFSCRTRNFCPSCQAKRSLLFAEKLREQILQPVPHRHYTFSIPKALRRLFERERRLLSLLSQTAYESIRKSFQKLLHRKDVQPGVVTSLQTFRSFAANFNPHCHGLVTEGAFTPQGEFLPLPTPATYLLADIEERFRQLRLSRLHRAERLSEAFMNTFQGVDTITYGNSGGESSSSIKLDSRSRTTALPSRNRIPSLWCLGERPNYGEHALSCQLDPSALHSCRGHFPCRRGAGGVVDSGFEERLRGSRRRLAQRVTRAGPYA